MCIYIYIDSNKLNATTCAYFFTYMHPRHIYIMHIILLIYSYIHEKQTDRLNQSFISFSLVGTWISISFWGKRTVSFGEGLRPTSWGCINPPHLRHCGCGFGNRPGVTWKTGRRFGDLPRADVMRVASGHPGKITRLVRLVDIEV